MCEMGEGLCARGWRGGRAGCPAECAGTSAAHRRACACCSEWDGVGTGWGRGGGDGGGDGGGGARSSPLLTATGLGTRGAAGPWGWEAPGGEWGGPTADPEPRAAPSARSRPWAGRAALGRRPGGREPEAAVGAPSARP